MENGKVQKIGGAVILILIIVIYSFYRMHATDAVSITIGVDDSKIGIVRNEEEPVFIDLSDVEEVELTNAYSQTEGQEWKVYVDDKIGEYIIIRTKDTVYVVNTNNKNATKTVYKNIQNALTK